MTRSLFETRRLCVRELDAGDLPALYAVYSDPVGARWVGDGTPISWADSERWIEVTRSNYENRGYGMSAVTLREEARVIGFCGLVHPDGQATPEIKYALARACWQGYASELVPALLAWGAAGFGMERIIATIHPDNLASQRVVVRAGMAPLAPREEADGEQTLVFEWRACEPQRQQSPFPGAISS